MAARLLDRFGSLMRILAPSSQKEIRLAADDETAAAISCFATIMGFALAEQIAVRPVLASSRAVHDHLRFTAGFELIEHSRVLFLDSKNGLITDEVLWSGTVDQATIHCRELLARALDLGASALILVHNHPSGCPQPSRSDIAVTQRITRAAQTLGIAVIDHIIVASTGTASMRALGFI